MIFQWLSLNSYYIQFVKVSTVHKRNLVHNDQLSFEMSWHQWPWTIQWSLVNRRNAAWMGPLSSWIWSLENCPVEVLLRCFKGLAWMWPDGSNWPLIMATTCQWVECCRPLFVSPCLITRFPVIQLFSFGNQPLSDLFVSFFVQGVFLCVSCFFLEELR